MLRVVACYCICLLSLALGCEKKEPPQEPLGSQSPAQHKAPKGYIAIGDIKPVYFSTEAVTVGDYVEYLRQSAQPVPKQWQGLKAGAPGWDLALTGLTRAEAETYAIWAMRRLPTPQEWEQAVETVGTRPYPWRDGEPAEPGARLYLVSEWKPGAECEESRNAARLKEALPAALLAEHRSEVDQLRTKLQESLQDIQERRAKIWRDLKPAYFELLDKQKEVTQQVARSQQWVNALQILDKIGEAKGRMAAKLATWDLTPEQAQKLVEQYSQQLSQTVEKVQSTRKDLEEKTKQLQEEVVALTKEFERSGARKLAASPEKFQQTLDQTSEKAKSIEEALARKADLNAALEKVKSLAPTLEGIPSREEIRQQMERLQNNATQLAGQEETQAKLDAAKQALQQLSESIKREFSREQLLVEELSKLVDLRARKEAIETKLKALRAAVGGEE